MHENQVLFSTDGVWLTTRRIDGQFPNYRQLLPEAFEHELTLPRAELLDVVRRASVMIQRATPLQLRFAEGELTVIARTHEVGESQESMPVALHRRDARDRLQRRLPARRARVDGRRRRALEADQPAAAGGDPGRGRRLHVPRHADPPARLASPTGRHELAATSGRTRGSSSSLQPGLVLAVGPNGVGKTNLLEALHVGDAGLLAAHAHRRAADPLRRRGGARSPCGDARRRCRSRSS